jgi:hypothetical protein
MRFSLILFLLCVSVTAAGPVVVDVGKGDVAVYYDPTQPNEKISIVWLSYCIGRLHYVVMHRHEYPKKISGELVPKFKEEVEARFVGVDTYKNLLGKDLEADAYWDAVRKASEAGFLEEYVWTYFRKDTWPLSEKPAKMEAFAKWAEATLPNHTPVTYGTLVGKKG